MDAGLPRDNTPSRYLDSTTKSPYGRTVVNQYLHRIIEAAGLRQILGEYLFLLWRSTHCRGRWKVEEYSSLEVPDSDNNSTKEFVEFSEPSFRTNFAESPLEVASEIELRISHFPFGSHFRIPLPSSERRNLKCSELRERENLF